MSYFFSFSSDISILTTGFLFAHVFHLNPIPASYSAYAYVNPISQHSTHSYTNSILSPNKSILNQWNNQLIYHDMKKHTKCMTMMQMKNRDQKDGGNVAKHEIIQKSIASRVKVKVISLYGMVTKRIIRTKSMIRNIVPDYILKRTRWNQPILSQNQIDAIKSKSTINESTLKPLTLNPIETELETTTELSPIITDSSSIKTDRSETCHPTTDLSGSWSLVITPEFKHEYDLYLKAFQQSAFFRAVALHSKVLSMTKETLVQTKNGKELTIKGTNPRGVWERTLCSTTAENTNITCIQNAGGAIVETESWWDRNGKYHFSWVRKAKEGDFFSKRYINENGYYVCESSFFRKLYDGSVEEQPTAQMTWTFQRNRMNQY